MIQQAFIEDHRKSMLRLSRDDVCDIAAKQCEFFSWRLPTVNPLGRLRTKKELVDKILSAKPNSKLLAFLEHITA